ncbi:N(2)-fixation sustaining protein CowN [Halochromatium glycolicum]|uniref:N(2)-fixation sustaining protein CowN n=1 Tax=Halochromatium glycolicum TaxID=85075 RepID=A0AAJ0U1A5_9GAMM|nr:N(2)-fixation sustaining protein CowN [Halochromatium glycolicum]MBK1703406.1 hypothetical protein [Halochromatium glycolicum]
MDAVQERPDRYISFRGIDCDGNAQRFVTALRVVMDHGERDDPFWRYFEAKLDGRNGPEHDALYHIHCHLNPLRELLERWGEQELEGMLEELELECC